MAETAHRYCEECGEPLSDLHPDNVHTNRVGCIRAMGKHIAQLSNREFLRDKPVIGEYCIEGEVWPGLSKLIEEAGEVQQVCGKIVGCHGAVDHWDGSNLRQRLEEEIADVIAACRFVIQINVLDNNAIMKRSATKYDRFMEWRKGNGKEPQSTDTATDKSTDGKVQ